MSARAGGAFTQVLLEALGKGDADQNGLLSITELTDYLMSHVPALTGGQQTLGIEVRFESDVFAAGV